MSLALLDGSVSLFDVHTQPLRLFWVAKKRRLSAAMLAFFPLCILFFLLLRRRPGTQSMPLMFDSSMDVALGHSRAERKRGTVTARRLLTRGATRKEEAFSQRRMDVTWKRECALVSPKSMLCLKLCRRFNDKWIQIPHIRGIENGNNYFPGHKQSWNFHTYNI